MTLNELFHSPLSLKVCTAVNLAFHQVFGLGESIRFTSECELAIQKGLLSDSRETVLKKLRDLTSPESRAAMKGNPVLKAKAKNLVVRYIHNIYVVDQLIRAKVQIVQDWEWHKQLRYRPLQTLALLRKHSMS